MFRFRPHRLAGMLMLAFAAAGAQAAAVSATASVTGTGSLGSSQSFSTTTAGVTVQAAGTSAVGSLDGCTPGPTQDNTALGSARAVADYGQLKIYASGESDLAYQRHNGPTAGGQCDLSSTRVITSETALARFSDELTVTALDGSVGTTIDILVHGYWDALLSTNLPLTGPNLTASVSLGGVSVVNDTAVTAPRTTVDADTVALGRTFEKLISITVGQTYSLSASFIVNLAASQMLNSLGCTPGTPTCSQWAIFDGGSTFQITDFVLPSGFTLSGASGQIADYGDHFAYLSVGGPVGGGGAVPEPGTLLLLATAGLALVVRRRTAAR